MAAPFAPSRQRFGAYDGDALVGWSYGWIERRFDLANVMRVCLLLEVLSHAAFALTSNGNVAMLIMVVFGAYRLTTEDRKSVV